MKIAIFTNTFWPSKNGVAVSATNLRQELLALGHEVLVFAPTVDGLKTKDDLPKVFRFPSIQYPQYPLALPFQMQKIKKTLLEEKIELIHSEHPWWVGSWALKFAKELNLPLITTIHTRYELYLSKVPLPKSWVLETINQKVKKYCDQTDLVTTPGFGSRERLLKLKIKTPVIVVSNPTDLKNYNRADGQSIRQKFGIQDSAPVAGYVGRLSSEKNLSILLNAFAQFRAKLPGSRLLLVGDSNLRHKLKTASKKIPGIIFAGAVDHKQISDYLAAFDLFLTASTSEVQPMTYAESLAAGRPIIAFDVAGNNDMIVDNQSGVLVPEELGSEGLADAAYKLLVDKEKLTQLQTKAKQSTDQFGLRAATLSMVEAYKKAIALHEKDSADS